MMSPEYNDLRRPPKRMIMHASATLATIAALCLFANCALAQQQQAADSNDLDVTMQIIVDPDAKLPDEVIRRIPLPARKPNQPSAGTEPAGSKASAQGQERAREARELGHEMSERAKERAQEAATRREDARRSAAEERRRNPGPPIDPPGPRATPPHR